MLHGRETERARLRAMVDGARNGQASALLLHGEPGVGKTALLDDLSADVAGVGVRVLATQGVESESPLAFGALQRLLRPGMRLLDRVPGPQARALRVAFGLEDGTVEPFLVGAATLSLLGELAEECPVLCVVDDAHWLDGASADALLFAARRFDADRVAVVFAARDGDVRSFTAPGIDALLLAGLDPVAVRALLAQHAGAGLSAEVADRLMAETAGNPLALVELPAGLTPEQLDGTVPLPPQLSVGSGVERVFLDRIRRLPDQVQQLMLVVAADDSGHVATTGDAAASLGVEGSAWRVAERSGLLLVDGDTVAVRHPMVRSAVYQAATSLERRHVHQALADVLDAAGDHDRATWHRAAAATGWDEPLAEDLAGVAVRAERRGGYAAAASAYERAAALTAREHPRAAHLFAAARTAWAAGNPTQASALAIAARELTQGLQSPAASGATGDRTDGQVDPCLLRADIDRLRGRIEVNVGSAAEAHRIFVHAAAAVAHLDHIRALEMAVAETVMHNYGVDSGASLDLGVLDLAVDADDPARVRCLKHLLVAMIQVADGDWAAARATLGQALEVGRDVTDVDVLGNLGNAALHLGDDEAARRFYAMMLVTARDAGAGMSVIYALQRLAFPYLVAGRWAEVRACAEEALSLARSVGQPALTATPLAWLTLLAALQGRPDYDTLLADLERVLESARLGILTDPVHDLTRWAKGVHAAALGEAATAVHHLGRMRLQTVSSMAAPDRIEAAIRAGDRAAAATWVEQLERFTDATGWPWAQATVDYGHAVLADLMPEATGGTNPSEEEAATRFERASAHRDGVRPYNMARAQLAYGEWLRRNQHRVEARAHLRSALEAFTDLGAEPFVTRAAEELRASGETARKRDPSTLVDLTPMELKIATLVSGGLSNKVVAAQCWISPRTVAFHLRNIFAKTGVTSRGELAQLPLG
ncbi:MAG TPA: AAA family ATPase [Nocardioidaceae bacterium]|jgi:DNA-binding CsgD family transcriptional regulator|nr:AAA family ATPase [Nocardioidaceae bacterium]